MITGATKNCDIPIVDGDFMVCNNDHFPADIGDRSLLQGRAYPTVSDRCIREGCADELKLRVFCSGTKRLSTCTTKRVVPPVFFRPP